MTSSSCEARDAEEHLRINIWAEKNVVATQPHRDIIKFLMQTLKIEFHGSRIEYQRHRVRHESELKEKRKWWAFISSWCRAEDVKMLEESWVEVNNSDTRKTDLTLFKLIFLLRLKLKEFKVTFTIRCWFHGENIFWFFYLFHFSKILPIHFISINFLLTTFISFDIHDYILRSPTLA